MVVVIWVINSTNRRATRRQSRLHVDKCSSRRASVSPLCYEWHCNAQQCRSRSDSTLKDQTSHVLSSQTSSPFWSETWTMVKRVNEAIVMECETSM